jgi:hypothetical protein
MIHHCGGACAIKKLRLGTRHPGLHLEIIEVGKQCSSAGFVEVGRDLIEQ